MSVRPTLVYTLTAVTLAILFGCGFPAPKTEADAVATTSTPTPQSVPPATQQAARPETPAERLQRQRQEAELQKQQKQKALDDAINNAPNFPFLELENQLATSGRSHQAVERQFADKIYKLKVLVLHFLPDGDALCYIAGEKDSRRSVIFKLPDDTRKDDALYVAVKFQHRKPLGASSELDLFGNHEFELVRVIGKTKW